MRASPDLLRSGLCFYFSAMAVVKYGAIVTEIKGKIGGTVFQGGISGPVAGNKAHISKTSVTLGKQQRSTSSKLITQHNNLALVATNWKNLTDTQRTAWNGAAVNFPFITKFGEAYTGSGFQLYMQMAINALTQSLGLITDPPTPATLAVAAPFTISAVTGTDTYKISTTVSVLTTVVLYASSSLSPGLALAPSMLKAIAILTPDTVFPLDVTAAYKNVFGTIPTSSTTWWRCTPLSQLDYRQGVPVNLKYTS